MPPEDCSKGVLNCTMTLMLLDGLASNGSRSGEILELPAKARPARNKKNAKSAVRAARREYFKGSAGIMALTDATQLPEHKCSKMNQFHSWVVLF